MQQTEKSSSMLYHITLHYFSDFLLKIKHEGKCTAHSVLLAEKDYV